MEEQSNSDSSGSHHSHQVPSSSKKRRADDTWPPGPQLKAAPRRVVVDDDIDGDVEFICSVPMDAGAVQAAPAPVALVPAVAAPAARPRPAPRARKVVTPPKSVVITASTKTISRQAQVFEILRNSNFLCATAATQLRACNRQLHVNLANYMFQYPLAGQAAMALVAALNRCDQRIQARAPGSQQVKTFPFVVRARLPPVNVLPDGTLNGGHCVYALHYATGNGLVYGPNDSPRHEAAYASPCTYFGEWEGHTNPLIEWNACHEASHWVCTRGDHYPHWGPAAAPEAVAALPALELKTTIVAAPLTVPQVVSYVVHHQAGAGARLWSSAPLTAAMSSLRTAAAAARKPLLPDTMIAHLRTFTIDARSLLFDTDDLQGALRACHAMKAQKEARPSCAGALAAKGRLFANVMDAFAELHGMSYVPEDVEGAGAAGCPPRCCCQAVIVDGPVPKSGHLAARYTAMPFVVPPDASDMVADKLEPTVRSDLRRPADRKMAGPSPAGCAAVPRGRLTTAAREKALYAISNACAAAALEATQEEITRTAADLEIRAAAVAQVTQVAALLTRTATVVPARGGQPIVPLAWNTARAAGRLVKLGPVPELPEVVRQALGPHCNRHTAQMCVCK